MVQIENIIYKMQFFIERHINSDLRKYLQIFPAVAILGPRQCGKSSLIKNLHLYFGNIIYLDLQNQSDLNKLADPILFFESNAHNIICLDEIQLLPQLFSVLRSVIDNNRKNGRFILLGSASKDLMQQTSESLAGRIGMLNMTPFALYEIDFLVTYNLNTFWHRGGFPDSYLADDDQSSSIWRQNYIRTYIERDIPQLGFQIPALQLKRLLTMCAHNQGQTLNLSKLAESMSLTHPTIKRYIDLLEQTFVLRTIQPFEANVKKRLVKSPKVYIRDSGILHELLSIPDFNALLGHPVFGSSWEGLAIENILTKMTDWNYFFYRTATGDELDLVLQRGNYTIAIECKASTAPKPTKGFWKSLDVVKPQKSFIVAPVNDQYDLKENVTVLGLANFLKIDFTKYY